MARASRSACPALTRAVTRYRIAALYAVVLHLLSVRSGGRNGTEEFTTDDCGGQSVRLVVAADRQRAAADLGSGERQNRVGTPGPYRQDRDIGAQGARHR